jgi:regulator of replication initiation timing
MSAVLETYFQHVVVDKLNETLSKQFEEMKDDLQVLKKLQSDYTNLRIELETLKKRVSDSGNEIKEILSQNGKMAAATRKPAPVKTAVEKKPVAKKLAVKKKTMKK